MKNTSPFKKFTYFVDRGIKKVFLLAGILVFVSCSRSVTTPEVTSTSTLSLPSTPFQTPAQPSTSVYPKSISPTATQNDLIEELSLGTYIVYWRQMNWRVKGIDKPNVEWQLPIMSSKLNSEISISRDGNLVVFSSTTGTLSIYDLRTSRMTAYPNPQIRTVFDLQWTADSQAVLYLGTLEEFPIPDARVGVYSVSLATGDVSAIVSWKDNRFPYGIRGLNLSNDGQWLAFFAPRFSEVMTPDPNYAVYLMDTSCLQKPETCAELIQLAVDGNNPAWSPDGELSWVCSDGTLSALCITDISSLVEPRIILTTSDLKVAAEASITDFIWSPDGKYIALNLQKYLRVGLEDVTGEIYLIPMTNGGQPIKVTSSTDKDEYWNAWSPDGKYLVYSRSHGYTEPYGDLGIRFPVTDLYLYDIENRNKVDFINPSDDREVFGFFIDIK